MSFFRTFFPAFTASNEVYLDTAATSQRVGVSIAAMQEYYHAYNANVHRGSYASAIHASNKYEDARSTIADFLGAGNASQIVFTSGATGAINMIASGLDINDVRGSEIWVCESEHHANLLPWQAFAKKHNLSIKRIRLGDGGIFSNEQLNATLADLTSEVAILAIAHVSNALGNIYPVAQLCKKANEIGAISVIDGTQACAHIAINVSALDCDFYAISGHKMYAGTGIGALYGKTQWLEKLNPSTLGGEMISAVTWDNYTVQPPPAKFEAGTPNIAGAIGMAQAARFIAHHSAKIESHELILLQHLLAMLKPLVDAHKIIILGNVSKIKSAQAPVNHIALVSFYSPIMHANDVATHLASQRIAVRSGHHCAMPLMHSLAIEGCVRASIGCYTSVDELNAFVNSLNELFDQDKTNSAKTQNDARRAADTSANTTGADTVNNVLPTSVYTTGSNKDEQTLLNSDTVNFHPLGKAISSAHDWNAKHRLLLLNSKSLLTLPQAMCTHATEVLGCEAKVWLTLMASENGSKRLFAYSQSKVIRGILALISERVNYGLQRGAVDLCIVEYLKEIGLSHYFSQGRRDGVSQLIHRVTHEYEACVSTS